MSLANKFEICTKYNRTDRYTIEKYEEGMYHNSAVNGVSNTSFMAQYTEAFVQACLTEGDWIMTANLSEHLDVPQATEVAAEREMVFPFVAKHKNDTKDYRDNYHVVSKSISEGMVDVHWYHTGNTYYKSDYSFWTIEDAKRLVKQGIWIVKHVGEKAEEKVDKSFEFFKDVVNANAANKKVLAEAPQSPESTTVSTLKVDIQCDTTEAVANAKALAGALEEINVAMESYIALVKEMKSV